MYVSVKETEWELKLFSRARVADARWLSSRGLNGALVPRGPWLSWCAVPAGTWHIIEGFCGARVHLRKPEPCRCARPHFGSEEGRRTSFGTGVKRILRRPASRAKFGKQAVGTIGAIQPRHMIRNHILGGICKRRVLKYSVGRSQRKCTWFRSGAILAISVPIRDPWNFLLPFCIFMCIYLLKITS